MTHDEEREMHRLARLLETLTQGTAWEAGRYMAIGNVMAELAKFCAVCDCQAKAKKRCAAEPALA